MIFRVARHTNNLNAIKDFYQKILGFELLGQFTNHSGYDGVFLGLKELGWHLEFTQSKDVAHPSFDEDDILVFYPENILTFNAVIENIETYAVSKLEPKNPYWKTKGMLIKDPDGYNIIVSDLKIT
ncbi:MAG: catechol 2,3-dioxygenase-like lactoylglutathione lyase family enzyme [Patiriisocius sp.]|jgi:catechol 2,3-dioxygenase-like lactoylglutathione lyase family enzyme